MVYSLLEATSDCACIFIIGDCRLHTKYENFPLIYNNRRNTKKRDVEVQHASLISQRSNISHLPQHSNSGVVSSPDTAEKRKEGLVF